MRNKPSPGAASFRVVSAFLLSSREGLVHRERTQVQSILIASDAIQLLIEADSHIYKLG